MSHLLVALRDQLSDDFDRILSLSQTAAGGLKSLGKIVPQIPFKRGKLGTLRIRILGFYCHAPIG